MRENGDVSIRNAIWIVNTVGCVNKIAQRMAAGVHMVLFTTGRGTPLSGPVPTVKIATNHELAVRKKNWIDFDASPLLGDITMQGLTNELFSYILKVASGEETCNERYGYREISIFKGGVTL